MAKNKQQGITLFRMNLMLWNSTHNHRQMPWKGEKKPYKIWLSEIILQQTRVEQGWAYYEKFIKHFPTIKHLAKAKDDDVFKLWEGLGYYSRCKNLLVTARLITTEFDGEFPDKYEAILELKGIGPYTAAAIASFAFNLPHAVVDGNVFRVLARYFGIQTPSDSSLGKKLFKAQADECLDQQQPGQYNQAIMDFGATICTPANAMCHCCPLAKQCVALQKNMVGTLPIKTKQLLIKRRWFTYFIIEKNKRVLVRKRVGKDIWQSLHEFIMHEAQEPRSWGEKQVKKFLQQHLSIEAELVSISETYTQKLTHQIIYAQFIEVKIEASFTPPGDYFFQPKKTLSLLAFPKTITQYLQRTTVQTVIL